MADDKMKKIIKSQWDMKGLAANLGNQPWHITEGPTSHGSVRIDRMSYITSYRNIESLAKDTVSEKELEEARANDTLPELLDDVTNDYMEILGELVAEEMGEHVYGTFEEGDAFIGQYEDGKLEELEKEFNIER